MSSLASGSQGADLPPAIPARWHNAMIRVRETGEQWPLLGPSHWAWPLGLAARRRHAGVAGRIVIRLLPWRCSADDNDLVLKDLNVQEGGSTDPAGGSPDVTIELRRRCQADLELVQSALTGDPESLRDLGDRLMVIPKLVATANRRLPRPLPPEEVADVAQDTAMRIWQRLETYAGRATLEGWVWGFTVFELRNRVRGVARRSAHHGPSLSSIETEPPAPTAEAMPFSSEDLELALRRLSGDMAEVVRLKHSEGLMFKEIAARLKIPENTAKTRYYRGIAQMRGLLDEIATPKPRRTTTGDSPDHA